MHGVKGRKSLKYGNYQCVRVLRYLRIFSVFGGSRHLSGEPQEKNIFRPPKNSYLLLNIYIYIYTENLIEFEASRLWLIMVASGEAY